MTVILKNALILCLTDAESFTSTRGSSFPHTVGASPRSPLFVALFFSLLYATLYEVLHLDSECRLEPAQKVVDLRDELSVGVHSGAAKRQREKEFMQILVFMEFFQTFAVWISLSVYDPSQDEETVSKTSGFTD